MTPLASMVRSHEKLIQTWEKLPKDLNEAGLTTQFVYPLLQSLNLDPNQIVSKHNLGHGAGLIPDFLVYADLERPPALVVEVKKRVSVLSNCADSDFVKSCQTNNLYLDAIGCSSGNGIKQYLDKSNLNINPTKLASYGLVINGDFFQLWRRVDGLILPLTSIQRITASTLPELMEQLEYCLYGKPKALVTAIWNRKGGVAKTTNTLNLASVLALEGKKVLLLDLDTQNDLTRSFKIDPQKYKEYFPACLSKIQAGYLDEAKYILHSNIQTFKYPTTDQKSFSISILPGEDKSQEWFKKNATELDLRGKIVLLQKMIALVAEEYDYIFLDTSPASDDLTIAALSCCNTFLIPSDYSKKTLHHAVDLYHQDAQVLRNNLRKNKLHIGPWNLGLVFSNCPSGVTPESQLEQCIQAELLNKGFTGYQCKTRLAIYAQTKLAEYKHMPVICWQNSPITKLYKDLANEVFLGHHFTNN